MKRLNEKMGGGAVETVASIRAHLSQREGVCVPSLQDACIESLCKHIDK